MTVSPSDRNIFTKMRRDVAVLSLISIVTWSALIAAGPVELQVSVDPNRPLALYQGPQSHRRDARGRPFKAIIVTSKPFGIGNADSNSVRDSPTSSTTPRPNIRSTFKPFIITSRPFGFASGNNQLREKTSTTTTTTTTTTTASPLGSKVTPTIPFFSISCTVGSSCSQIISARQTVTSKPTFKPYTKEEINKFKETLNSRFPSKIGTVASQVANVTRKTSTGSGNNLWRIRTTSPAPSTAAASSTTTTRPNPPSKSKPSSNNWNAGRWKWPTHIGSAAFQDPERDQVDSTSNNQRIETVTSVIKTPLSLGQQTTSNGIVNGKPENDYESSKDTFLPATTTSVPIHREKTKVPSANAPNAGGWFAMLAASLNTLQTHQTLAQRPQQQQQQQPQKSKTTLSTPLPVKIINRPAKPRPNYLSTTTTAPTPDRWTQDANQLEWQPEKGAEPVLSITLAENQNYHHHQVVSSKGNKISLITGSSTRNKLANNKQSAQSGGPATVPPEVSVSSHVIGLKVKPKSLEGSSAFIENVQGVAIETDGENVNLSDLIMKQELPRRPARYLPHSSRIDERGRWRTIDRQPYGAAASYRPISNPSFVAMDGWRPVRFPNP